MVTNDMPCHRYAGFIYPVSIKTIFQYIFPNALGELSLQMEYA